MNKVCVKRRWASYHKTTCSCIGIYGQNKLPAHRRWIKVKGIFPALSPTISQNVDEGLKTVLILMTNLQVVIETHAQFTRVVAINPTIEKLVKTERKVRDYCRRGEVTY